MFVLNIKDAVFFILRLFPHTIEHTTQILKQFSEIVAFKLT